MCELLERIAREQAQEFNRQMMEEGITALSGQEKPACAEAAYAPWGYRPGQIQIKGRGWKRIQRDVGTGANLLAMIMMP